MRDLDPTRGARVRLRTGELFPLSATEQPFGGVRWFFVCPCGRRCMALYLYGRTFRCRQCHGLVYPTQNMARRRRSAHMAEKLWQRVATEDPESGARVKLPKLRRRTFNRTAQRAEEYERAAQAVADRRGPAPEPVSGAQRRRAL